MKKLKPILILLFETIYFLLSNINQKRLRLHRRLFQKFVYHQPILFDDIHHLYHLLIQVIFYYIEFMENTGPHSVNMLSKDKQVC